MIIGRAIPPASKIFEGMTASTTPPADRARHNPVLYAVATLFYYQAAMP